MALFTFFRHNLGGLLTIADLSLAVPATAVTYVFETGLAKYV